MGMNGILPLRDVSRISFGRSAAGTRSQAVEVGPRFLLGGIAAAYDYDWRVAVEHFDAALAANPVFPNARWAYASFYSNPFGRFQDSVANMRLEVEQDPLNTLWRCIFANHLQHAGMYPKPSRKPTRLWTWMRTSGWLTTTWRRFTSRPESSPRPSQRARNTCRSAPWNSMATGVLAAALVRVGERDVHRH